MTHRPLEKVQKNSKFMLLILFFNILNFGIFLGYYQLFFHSAFMESKIILLRLKKKTLSLKLQALLVLLFSYSQAYFSLFVAAKIQVL